MTKKDKQIILDVMNLKLRENWAKFKNAKNKKDSDKWWERWKGARELKVFVAYRLKNDKKK